MELKRKMPAPEHNFSALEEMYGRHNSGKATVAIVTSLILLILVAIMIVTHGL